ncbi:hypothetical protein F6B93_06245 [Mycobacterium spongiae]|uniref:Uncharacterized protein n=1 Tax=Mycobacterium spongiae TaxID=886343 RepID=A0A975PWG7_9MYCO|nr:hypothetical protein F6B93_06245 [Mycobacterium spongiae]
MTRAPPTTKNTTAAAIAQPAPANHQTRHNNASTGDNANNTNTGCCLITSNALVARTRSISLPAIGSGCQTTAQVAPLPSAAAAAISSQPPTNPMGHFVRPAARGPARALETQVTQEICAERTYGSTSPT